MKIVVAPGRSVMAPRGGGQFLPGTDLVPHIGEAKARELLANGFAVKSYEDEPDVVTGGKAPGNGAVDTGSPSAEKWGMDPLGLQGYGLEKLNLMIAERDPSIEAFEDEAEAIAWLSKDFKAPGTPLAPVKP